MDRSVYEQCEDELFSQKDLLEALVAFPGLRLKTRPPKGYLLHWLDHIRESQAEGTQDPEASQRTTSKYMIPAYYPPCTQSHTALTKLTISDLRVDTHHVGQVLIVKLAAKPVKGNGLLSVIEDHHGNAEKLVVYNQYPDAPADEILPEGAALAIKQPYYFAVGGNAFAVRVDHVSDLVVLARPDVQVRKTAQEWKMVGDAAMAEENPHKAIRCYTRGISAVDSEDAKDIKHDLLLHRAAAYSSLGMYEAARADCQVKLDECPPCHDEVLITQLSRALYGLERFDECRAHLVDFLSVNNGNETAAQHLQHIEARCKEQGGEYDFETYFRQVESGATTIEVASFTSDTEVKDAGNAGRGLFAAKAFKAGDVVLAEKALAVTSSGINLHTHCIMDVQKEKLQFHSGTSLLVSLVQAVRRNPDHASKLLRLSSGGYPKFAKSVAMIDGLPVIDTFQIYHTMLINSMNTRFSGQESGSGVFTHASYLNHSCSSNCVVSSIANIIVIRATRDIEEGEQLLWAYIPIEQEVELRRRTLKRAWDFHCECNLCIAEQSAAERSLQQRQEFQATRLLFNAEHQPPASDEEECSYMDALSKLYPELARTYDPDLYKDLPRLGLLDCTQALFMYCWQKADCPRAFMYALEHLRNLGFMPVVDIEAGTITVNRSTAIVATSKELNLVSACVCARDCARVLGMAAIAEQFEELAKLHYLMLTNADEKRFADDYPDHHSSDVQELPMD